MKELLLEIAICAAAAAFLMVFHELSKAIVYMGIQRLRKNSRTYSHSIWEIQRYLDPVGIILSITSGVAFSRPFMFRIQSKKVKKYDVQKLVKNLTEPFVWRDHIENDLMKFWMKDATELQGGLFPTYLTKFARHV